jgi:radical SAM protein with 4Fe4S-binding SPASM domain
MDKYSIDGHKLYWHLDRVLEWQEKGTVAPIYLEISPVSYCNNRCVFCGVDFAMDNKSRLDTEVLCERLTEMGRRGVKSIMFAGEGEPLLHKDIAVIIKTARESGIDVSMTTNGSLGNYELWQEILPHLTWIRFSLDAGSSGVYSKVHGVPESFFEKTINSIKDAVRVKNECGLDVTIGVQYLVIEENLADIENSIEKLTQLKVDYFSLKPYSFNPKMIKQRNELYTEETAQYVQDIVDRHSNGNGTNIIFRKGAMGKYMAGEKHFTHCYALPFYGYLSSSGDFYVCKEFIGEERFKAGNIYENDMHSIFFGEKRGELLQFGQDNLAVGEECRLNCRMARINEFLEVIENKPEHVNFI